MNLRVGLWLAVIALGLSSGLVYLKNQTQNSGDQPRKVAGSAIGGAYELVDQNGQVRTDQDFKDRYKLIYFGFTYCPVICPTELQKMKAALNLMPQEIAALIQPMFISIDPERDTPEVLKDYLSLFGDNFVGLTGSVKQVEDVKATYRVFAKKVQDDTMTEYTMDHSSYVYLMDPADNLLGIYSANDSAADIKADVEKWLVSTTK